MDEKRLEILERATSVYMKFGIKSVTMDDLARELGISKKTIYKYFDDKNDLVKSIIEMKVEMDRAVCINCQQQSENAIDGLINVSKFVVEHVGNVNPTVFYDLQKYYKEAWKIMEKHKWEFVLSMIRQNIERGIKEKIYRANLDVQIISRLYVASTDVIMNAEIFPWPEFKFQNLFTEMIQLHITGMANAEGIKYLKQKMRNEEI
ncbi:MAG: TetR/AcrR family transcriptional regulator [Crocinitomicaceae bacterium]|nr:TetR/AcrR family transcriptional regulator [Crocinitomicaceae bacterium]